VSGKLSVHLQSELPQSTASSFQLFIYRYAAWPCSRPLANRRSWPTGREQPT